MGSFFSPPSANVQAPALNTYQLPNIDQAAQGALGALGGIQNQYTPAAWQNYQNIASNPYFGGAIAGAQQAAGLGQGQALGQAGWGNMVSGQGAGLYPYAQGIMQTAMDPQSALYARTLQQVTEQTRAGQAARGIAMSPYGAGVENKALSDFNIDWQKQMLDRMIAGGNAAGGLYGQAGSQIAGGQQMGAAAPGQYYQASMYPYSVATGQGNTQMDALLKAYGIPSGLAQNYMGYTGQGMQGIGNLNTAQNAMFKNQLTQANDAFNQQNQMFKNLGQGIGFAAGFI